MSVRLTVYAALVTIFLPTGTNAAAPEITAVLESPLLDPNQPLADAQRFTLARIPEIEPVDSADAWTARADQWREEVLDTVVFRGRAAGWRDAETQVEWLDTIPGGPGYHIRKLRFEALPGLWIPALLYEPGQFDGPLSVDGRVPVVLNVNGHDGDGKVAEYKQIRCINQARRGMLALNVEWLGMGQLRGESYVHYRSNQIDLCGTSGLAPFYLSMSRALDLALAHPHADPQRVAVAGLSGGGWQTIIISALDPRVTLANPVAGYSSFRTRAQYVSDLGDSEQTPVDLATIVDYTHLTAMRAPRPTLLTYNAKDNCCFRADHALEPLLDAARPIFALYGREQNLASHVNEDPGDHNFGHDNRLALYRMFGQHFVPSAATFDTSEIPCEDELRSADELHVPLEEGNANFNTLALELSDHLPREAAMPQTAEEAPRWQQQRRELLARIVKYHEDEATALQLGTDSIDDVQVAYWKLRIGDDWTLPVVEFRPAEPEGLALVIGDEGRQAQADIVAARLAQQQRVLVCDVFDLGEAQVSARPFLWALLVSAVGERPLGVQAGQIAAIARWAHAHFEPERLDLISGGPRTSVMALVAAALETDAIGAVALHDPLGSLREVIERNWAVNDYPELFCFGLYEHFDVHDLGLPVVPRPITVHEASQRAASEMQSWDEAYALYAIDHDPLAQTSAHAANGEQAGVLVAGIVLKWLRGEKDANYARLEPLVRSAAAAGAEIICTTECFLDGYAIADKSIPLEEYRALGERIPDGPYFRRLAALADELDIHLVAGMLEADGELRYNTAVIIAPDGRLAGKYRKQRLGHESVRNTAGDASEVFSLPYGKLGVMICADRRYREVVDGFTERGAEFLLCPSGGMFGARRNDPIVQSRSRETGRYIVFVHPAEFLVTAPGGTIAARELVGDRLVIQRHEVGTAVDSSLVGFFRVPLPSAIPAATGR